MRRLPVLAMVSLLTPTCAPAYAQVCNIKVVTDASPDYSDMRSMVRSITGKWPTPKEKCWAVFYWNHIARRQTTPMRLHGLALTDPVRQFNDYGYTMCSTVAGINCAIWHNMGLQAKYWDITRHTVAEVRYAGRWHMYDSSMSAIYTLCDGVTLAGVEDIGAEGACEASGGKREPGHIAKYHCLNATSDNGFLTGADCPRDLERASRCFNPKGLMYRWYYYDWDWGHRYILNLRANEVYTRHYHRFGKTKAHYVPNGAPPGKDPESVNPRYRIRGNGVRSFRPALTADGLVGMAHSLANVRAVEPAGVQPVRAGRPAEVVFKIEGANVITSMSLEATCRRKTKDDAVAIAMSVTNGLHWQEVWRAEKIGEIPVSLKFVDEVNGAYEVLVRVTLMGKASASGARLKSIDFKTVTMLNSKTQPKLLLGRNTVYVGTGEQAESIVFWPDLRGERYKPYVVDQSNMVSEPKHPGYKGVMHAIRPSEEAYVVFKMDAPREITKITYGGRLYNRAPQSHIDFLHSFDGGKTWGKSYSLTDTEPPWDVIHYETIDSVPPGTKSVLFKYLLNSTAAGTSACSIFAVRMEANHRPARAGFTPLEVTFNWSEVQKDGSLVARSHTQSVESVPHRYTINVGGADHPVVNSLRVSLRGAVADGSRGYSDGKDVGGDKFTQRWVTFGKNLAQGKPYTVSVPSMTNWGAGDPEGKKLTDGVVGPPYAGGGSPRYALLWNQKTKPVVTVDLGKAETCGAFRVHIAAGWPWWDAMKGEVKDEVEVLSSTDGEAYISRGFFDFRLRWEDLPVNHFWPDDETFKGYMFELIPAEPVDARYVRLKITPKRMVTVSEVQVLDFIRYEPFDLRIVLPDEEVAESHAALMIVSPAGRPVSVVQAAKNRAEPVGEPVLESPTLHSLGAYWIVKGDANENAAISLSYREAGTDKWSEGRPLFRVEKGAHKDTRGQSTLDVSDDAWLFAGSALMLRPDTAHELRLRLKDPDGGSAEELLKARTILEPIASPGAAKLHVVPGSGGGKGTRADPYRGLAEAQAQARPGDVLLLHAGVYGGTFTVRRSGEPGRPIIWRGAGDGEAIIDGQGRSAKRPGRAVSANDAHNVWFEGLTIRNADYGFVGHNAFRIVIRRCRIHGVDYGVTCTNNSKNCVRDFFISDNTLEGPSTWPRTKGIENARGIQVTGTGHVVCYNRIRGFADAVDTFPSARCAAIDVHNNDISEMTDDGIEMDYSFRNTRCFMNRLTNVFQGISVQPVYGGPVYIFRNVMYNVAGSPFKMHNNPSGALMLHNTSVKKGMPMVCYGGPKVRNCVFRNNLFIGTPSNYAFESTATMVDCDFDYDGFGGGPWKKFLKWSGSRYGTLKDVKQGGEVYGHGVLIEAATAFASHLAAPDDEKKQFDGRQIDLRLSEDCAAVDAGQVWVGLNDAFTGAAPDLGAYELGKDIPHYGPR